MLIYAYIVFARQAFEQKYHILAKMNIFHKYVQKVQKYINIGYNFGTQTRILRNI